MRAIKVEKYLDQPDELVESIVADPEPSPTQYLVAIHCVAANFFDVLQLQGKYQSQPAFPWIAGTEFAGFVISSPSLSGSTQPRFRSGDRVFGAAQGAFATLICVEEDQIRKAPDAWKIEDAAGLSVTAPTSYSALVTKAGVKKGDIVLIHAAAGGVGLAAVQIAKAFGATVIATAGSEAKLGVAKSFGADHLVSYADPAWPNQVKSITPKGRGVDIVFDPVGLINPSIRCTAWNGRIVVVGFAAGAIEKVSANRLLLKNISIQGLYWGSYVKMNPFLVEKTWTELEKLILGGHFRGTTFTDRKYKGLNSIGEALKDLAERRTWGKVVATIPQDSQARL